MALQDYNDNEDRLTAQRSGAGWSGLGRLAADNTPILVADNEAVYTASGGGSGGGGIEYTSYEDVTSTASTINTAVVPVVPRTDGTVQLPQFDFATGVSSCSSCTPAAPAAVAAANAAAVVTPMADAPKSINWLLILGAAGIGYFFLKGNPSPGMGNPATEPTPAPTAQDLGRPARQPKAKPKHVAHLEI